MMKVKRSQWKSVCEAKRRNDLGSFLFRGVQTCSTSSPCSLKYEISLLLLLLLRLLSTVKKKEGKKEEKEGKGSEKHALATFKLLNNPSLPSRSFLERRSSRRTSSLEREEAAPYLRCSPSA